MAKRPDRASQSPQRETLNSAADVVEQALSARTQHQRARRGSITRHLQPSGGESTAAARTAQLRIRQAGCLVINPVSAMS
jgi:hypothetical protein